MTYFVFISLTATLFIVAASPGPGVFITVSTSMSAGFYRTMYLIAGIVFGHVIFLELSFFGLSLAAKVLGSYFVWIKYIGGAYLIFLGLKIVFFQPTRVGVIKSKQLSSPAGNFVKGFLVTLSNPKALIFYYSIFPSFIEHSKVNTMVLIIVTLTVIFVFSLVLIAYSYAANRVSEAFSKRSSGKLLSVASGGIMILAGVAVAFATNR